MAVYSMTGFAHASAGAGGATDEVGQKAPAAGAAVSVEARSVNSRFLDLAFRLPDELRGLEPALRELLGAAFRRGKIELRVATQREADSGWPQPQPEQLSKLSRLESTVAGWLPKAQPLSVNEALLWCRQGGASERLDEAALAAAREAIAGLRDARAREGARLVDVLMERIDRLRELAAQAAPLVPAVVQRQQQRFLERWNEALHNAGAAGSVSADALRDRALSEAAAYALRIDVAEELARLSAHLDEITRLLQAGGELGKRLDFLIQELQREANTLGSKASALELTNVSVEMKVAIEQMREQVQNIE
ncbi:MAG: YicC family protein [Burkholderiaceae bacterium]|nr:YicC family protein [Burkholderiaceae bacterium]